MRARWSWLLVAAACGSHAGPSEHVPARPPVLVTIVVDQLPAWAALEKVPLLPDDGGFARLRREGTWMRDVRYAHAMTHTGPGHAALYTGRPPVESGIGTDSVFVMEDGKPAEV
ncbi:MAG TPA: alkaline phosphatase family protein, partial [Kofleriaceae bacterium]|nr:alkaline phosphatase family protein [Kofleriaceae bacterium]